MECYDGEAHESRQTCKRWRIRPGEQTFLTLKGSGFPGIRMSILINPCFTAQPAVISLCYIAAYARLQEPCGAHETATPVHQQASLNDGTIALSHWSKNNDIPTERMLDLLTLNI